VPTSSAPRVPVQRRSDLSIPPRQRWSAGISLTQRGARSGQVCPECGDGRLTELTMTLTDGTDVEFTACQHCETRSWRSAGESMTMAEVLERTRRDR
jgi:hypothetical protein